MASPPQLSPLTGEPVPPNYLHASSAFFRDNHGRAILLRGINLSGSSKAPLQQPSQRTQGFWEDAENGTCSFVGQPLNIEDGSADVHLRRLRLWGFNCFRYVFTWEALEHAGPGKYDYQYMDYVVAVLQKCKEHGFRVFMDPHQDVFSRFTGGSGAPYWVLPACGMDHRAFHATQAAFVHSEWPSPENPDPSQFPDMLWATGYTRLAPATLSVLFFAGHDYAPLCRIDGKPISEWLQDLFFAACRKLAVRIAAAPGLLDECVIGWDSINEPNPTYIGIDDLTKLPEKWKLRQGPMPTPVQSMALGAGMEQKVENWVFTSLGPKRAGEVVVSPQGASIWLSAEDDASIGGSKWGWSRDSQWPLGRCVWEAHGVWDRATGQISKTDYFSSYQNSRPVDFIADYWLPFWRKYKQAIRPVHKEAIMFIQPPVFEPPPTELTEEDLEGRACVSCHFYDGLTLVTKHWNWFNADAVGLMRGKYSSLVFALRFGAKAVRKVLRDQLGYLRNDTLDVLGQYPTLIGEIGIPYDLDRKKTYFGDDKGKGKGDYQAQTAALDASLNACDGNNVLSYTMWTYCPDNTHVWGDGWNGEDLSIWSLDDLADADGDARSRNPEKVPDVDIHSRMVDEASKLSTSSSGASARTATEELDLPPTLAALYSGSRSAAAFCRPYPIATVGTPVSINFDIKSSVFKYVVEVAPSDQGREANSEEDLATEIYVPLVHYAADDDLVQLLNGGSSFPGSIAAQRDDSSAAKPASSCTSEAAAAPDAPTSSRFNTLKVPMFKGAEGSSATLLPLTGRPSQGGTRTPSRTSPPSSDVSSVSATATGERPQSADSDSPAGKGTPRHADLVADGRLPPLALDVTVSAGRWEVSGQILKWYLPALAASSSRTGRTPPRQEITIRRRGGALGSALGSSSANVSAASMGDGASTQSWIESVWERLPCVIL